MQRRGYAVTAAADGPEALRCIADRAFDVVLLDVVMPGMGGLEVLEQIRLTRTPADLPVIMATANDQSEDIVKAFERGANDYVTKPLDFPVVLARVRTQISLKHSVQQILQLEHRLSERNKELEAANEQLLRAAARTRRELQTAAKVQESLLPKSIPETPGLKFAWAYRPCQQLAGDSLNVCPFGDGRVGVYVLDVAGHGVSASLLAVAATRLLSAHDPDSILLSTTGAEAGKWPASPVAVATRLDERFQWNPATEQFITIFYALVDPNARELTYVSAGHPGAIRLGRSKQPIVLDVSGMPIGFGETYEQRSVRLERGDRVYLYSDGVLETMNDSGQQFGRDRLIKGLERGLALDLEESVASLVEEIDAWCSGEAARDDVSLLGFECL
jgi:sigma-B regulation protein RsbU (phosphoserine phosphatase)